VITLNSALDKRSSRRSRSVSRRVGGATYHVPVDFALPAAHASRCGWIVSYVTRTAVEDDDRAAHERALDASNGLVASVSGRDTHKMAESTRASPLPLVTITAPCTKGFNNPGRHHTDVREPRNQQWLTTTA